MATWGSTAFALAGLLIAYALYSIGIATYNITFHPLAKFPGPKLAGAFHFVDLWHIANGNTVAYVKALHDTYGDVVRISPNALSFNSAQAFQDIYGYQKGRKDFDKDPLFFIRFPGIPDNILTANGTNHARYRRLLGYSFSESALREQEGFVRSYCDLLVSQLRKQIEGPTDGKVDVVRWLNFTTFDIIGDLAFGESFQALSKGEYHFWMAVIFQGVKEASVLKVALYYPFLKAIFLFALAHIPSAGDSIKKTLNYTQSKMDRRLQAETDRKDFISDVLRYNDEKGMVTEELYSNMSVVILAGSETSATLLSGLIFHLLKNPDAYTKITREVRTAFSSEFEMNFMTVAKLPYLQACIEEGLRIYPPVPMSQPRITPDEGATINGRFVPPDTSVGVHHFSTYHSERRFKDADKFVPERWLGDKRYADDDRDAFHPFSLGIRGCLGKNLAYAEMRSIIVRILWNFDLLLCPESQNWEKQKVYMLWEKPPLNIILSPKDSSKIT